MKHPYLSDRFRHVVFPGTARRQRLVNVAAGDSPPDPAEPEPPPSAHAPFFVWLFARAGLDARAYRTETLHRRLAACLRTVGARSTAEARQILEANPGLVPAAISAVVIGVTGFFRDPPVFDLLAHQFIPELAAGRGGLHVWSAGCSDGAELFSVGILLAEQNLLAASYLLGTDCRPDAILRAKDAAYDDAPLRNVRPEWLEKYFVAHGGRWHVAPALRLAARWRLADVLTTQEPGVWDVILFRNTAMYFRGEALAPLWERLEQMLRPGGVLVLGKAERPAGVRRLVPAGPCVYRRTRR